MAAAAVAKPPRAGAAGRNGRRVKPGEKTAATRRRCVVIGNRPHLARQPVVAGRSLALRPARATGMDAIRCGM
jgi:hypothetical protein